MAIDSSYLNTLHGISIYISSIKQIAEEGLVKLAQDSCLEIIQGLGMLTAQKILDFMKLSDKLKKLIPSTKQNDRKKDKKESNKSGKKKKHDEEKNKKDELEKKKKKDGELIRRKKDEEDKKKKREEEKKKKEEEEKKKKWEEEKKKKDAEENKKKREEEKKKKREEESRRGKEPEKKTSNRKRPMSHKHDVSKKPRFGGIFFHSSNDSSSSYMSPSP